MKRRVSWGIAVVLLLVFCAAAQAQESYLDEYVVHVAPGKRAAFDAVLKKLVAANRAHQGDNWVALETIYGEGSTITFVSPRQSYAEIEKANGAFMGAVEKALGHPATEKLFEDLGNYTAGSRSLLLRSRPDLSSNMPADPAARARIIGTMRQIRTIRIVVRIGQGPRFEELAKQVKAALEKADPNARSWISQSTVGERASVYYVSQPENSMAGFDSSNLDLSKIMGKDAYQNFIKAAGEVIQTEETTLSVFLPALSNPTPDIADAAPDFWHPKPATPKSTAAKPAPSKAPAENKP